MAMSNLQGFQYQVENGPLPFGKRTPIQLSQQVMDGQHVLYS